MLRCTVNYFSRIEQILDCRKNNDILTLVKVATVMIDINIEIAFQERGTGNCASLSHNQMDYECLIQMWNFYHIDNSGWEPCSTYLSSFSPKKYPASQSECLFSNF